MKFSVSIVRKWFAIFLIGLSIYFVGLSDETRTGLAAPCIQECETNQGSCIDECQESCNANSTASVCQSCVISCNSQFLSCLGNAVWCENEESTPGFCTTQYGSVCDVDYQGNPVNCQNRYYLTCPWSGGTCVNCFNKYCYGGGTPHCAT